MVHIICNSHYVSHFAAFFIVTGAKISVVESCLWFGSWPQQAAHQFWLQARFGSVLIWPARGASSLPPHKHVGQEGRFTSRPARPPRPGEAASAIIPKQPRSPSRGMRTASSNQSRKRSVGKQQSYRCGLIDSMILPQVHLRKPCYDFSFL